MPLSEQEIVNAFQSVTKRVEQLERTVQQLSTNEGRWQMTNQLHPISTNLSNIREMFLLEIIREAGLLDKADIDKVTEKVRARLVDAENIPWARADDEGGKANQRIAAKNLEQVVSEIRGSYATSDDSSDK
ncbi:hypothetical protein JZX87_10090 [Agrobacterium sp. Ap1]|uniref:hypothetical protein n=1 Tax=Agrobacterium sp. Ap1 TaxID=2815337 RepID=UPI001A8F809F|nr:hypothetical protein [Agrobacterium sp. Ap1]MBO0141512.1 hypothetical protein [Agrobacterium sp. Ap1]